MKNCLPNSFMSAPVFLGCQWPHLLRGSLDPPYAVGASDKGFPGVTGSEVSPDSSRPEEKTSTDLVQEKSCSGGKMTLVGERGGGARPNGEGGGG